MTRLFLLFFVFIGSFVNAQKKYHFDYALSYDNPIAITPGNKSNLFFINSKDNSFAMYVFDNKDSIHLNINLYDFKGLIVTSNIKKDLFYKAETIKNDCSSVLKGSNPFKYKSKEYVFEKLNDTIIKDSLYFHYVLKSIKSLKYQKNNKIVSTHFIIDKESSDFMPFLSHPTIYNNWIETLKLPNGIIKIKYDVDVEGKIVLKQELIKLVKIDKYMTIPEECDYTKYPK